MQETILKKKYFNRPVKILFIVFILVLLHYASNVRWTLKYLDVGLTPTSFYFFNKTMNLEKVVCWNIRDEKDRI